METSKFLALGRATTEIFKEISNETKALAGDALKEKQQDLLASKMPRIFEPFGELLINPSKEDLALISTEAAIASGFMSIMMQAKFPGQISVMQDAAKSFQRYLRFKAESMPENENLLALIDANLA